MKEDQISRRDALQKFVKPLEVAAVAPLAYLAYENVVRDRSYYQFNLNDAKLPSQHQEGPEALKRPFMKLKEFTSTLNELEQKYRSAYRKNRQVPATTVNANGKVKVKSVTQHYWDEEPNVPKYDALSKWKEFSEKIDKKFDSLTKNKLVNIEAIKDVFIEEKKTNKSTQSIVSGIMYGTSALALVSYEEIYTWALLNYREKFEDAYERSSSPEKSNRRNLLKISAALLGSALAFKIDSSIDDKLEAGRAHLEKSKEESAELNDLSTEKKVKSYFGYTLNELQAKVSKIVEKAHRSIEDGIQNEGIALLFNRLSHTGEEIINELSHLQNSEEAYHGLGILSASGTATKKLKNAGAKDEKLSSSGVVLESLGVVGAMTALLLPGEFMIQKIDDKKNLEED